MAESAGPAELLEWSAALLSEKGMPPSILNAKSFLLNLDWVDDVRAAKELPLLTAADADVAYTDKPLP